MTQAQCGNCRFHITGKCVRHAPFVGANEKAVWPGVSPYSWCGNHEFEVTTLESSTKAQADKDRFLLAHRYNWSPKDIDALSQNDLRILAEAARQVQESESRRITNDPRSAEDIHE